MFYSANDIAEITKCLACNGIFLNDPRILPCGFTICDGCHSQLLDKKDKKTKCLMCNRIHTIPEEGFPVNYYLSKLIGIKPRDVLQSSNVKRLREQLKRISDEVDALSCDLNNGTDAIKNHCNSIKNQVQLEVELLIENIHDLNAEFSKQIDEYQDSCIANYELKKGRFFSTCDQTVNEAKQFCHNRRQYLSGFEIDEGEIEQSLDKSNRCLSNLNDIKKYFDNFKFGGKLIKFEPSASKPSLCQIGELKLESLDNGILLLGNSREICLSDVFVDLEKEKMIDHDLFVFRVDVDSSYGFYLDKSLNLNIVHFDNSGKVLNLKSNCFKPHLTCLKVLKFGDNFLIYVHCKSNDTSKKRYDFSTLLKDEQAYLLVLDNNLNYKIYRKLNIPLKQVAVNSSIVLCLNDLGQLELYTKDLQQYKQKLSNKFQILEEFEISESCIFIQKTNNQVIDEKLLIIEDLKTGKVVKELKMGSLDQFKLAGTDHLIVFKAERNELECYEQSKNFKLINTVSLQSSIYNNFGKILIKDKSEFISLFLCQPDGRFIKDLDRKSFISYCPKKIVLFYD